MGQIKEIIHRKILSKNSSITRDWPYFIFTKLFLSSTFYPILNSILIIFMIKISIVEKKSTWGN